MSSASKGGVIYEALAPACLEVDRFIEAAGGPAFTISPRTAAKRNIQAGAGYGRGVIEYEHNELVEFNLADVGSVSGFSWGEVLYGLLNRWQESRGWSDGWSGLGFPYVNNNWFLWSAWKRFLEPESEYKSGEVVYEDSASNPLMSTVSKADHSVIGVAVAELIKLADEIFPPRSGQWLEIFSSLVIVGAGDEFDYLLTRQIADSFEVVRGEVGEMVWELFTNLLCTGYGAGGHGSFIEVARATAGAIEV